MTLMLSLLNKLTLKSTSTRVIFIIEIIWYLRAHRKRKWARKGLMLGSAVSMLGSLLVGVLPQQKYVGITLQVTGSLAFWGGLIYNINTNARYKKAIESFNRAEMETNGYQKPTSYIQIGIQPNGVGLSYLF